MAIRPPGHRQGNIAASTACLVLAALIAGPALAAPAHDALCDKSHDATLDVSENQLTATAVSHDVEQEASADNVDILSDDHLLKSSVEAIVREAFADDEDDAELAEALQTDADDPVILNTRVPGVSDDELARFKRQMFRKDI